MGAQKGVRQLQQQIKALTGDDKLVTMPLYTIPCSTHLEVGHVGRTPIRKFIQEPMTEGRYFEIRIDSVAEGATVGLALGCTTICHEGDEVKLSAMKPSWTAGYDGLLQAEDSWSEINWSPSHLRTGDRVGVLATPSGDFVLVENGELRICEPVGIKVGRQLEDDLYAIVLASQGVEISLLDVEPPPLTLAYPGFALPKSICEVIPIRVTKEVQDGMMEVARQIFVSPAAVHMAAWLAALESAPGMGTRPRVWKLGMPTERGNPMDWEDFVCPVDYLTIATSAEVEMSHEYMQDLYQEILRVTEAEPPTNEEELKACEEFHSVFGWELQGGGWIKWYEDQGVDENTCTHDHQFCVPTLMIYSHPHSGEMVGWLRRQIPDGPDPNKPDLYALASAYLGRCEVLSKNIPDPDADPQEYPNYSCFMKYGERKPPGWGEPMEYQKEWDEFIAACEKLWEKERRENPDYTPTMKKLFPGFPEDIQLDP